MIEWPLSSELVGGSHPLWPHSQDAPLDPVKLAGLGELFDQGGGVRLQGCYPPPTGSHDSKVLSGTELRTPALHLGRAGGGGQRQTSTL